jgi:hypothetical protein
MKLSHSKSQPTKIGSCESAKVLQIPTNSFYIPRNPMIYSLLQLPFATSVAILKVQENTLWQVALLPCWPPRVPVTCQSWEASKRPTTVAHCQWQVSHDRRHLEDRTNGSAKNKWTSHKSLKILALLWWGTSIQSLLRLSANILNHQLPSNRGISGRLSWSGMATAMLCSMFSRQ